MTYAQQCGPWGLQVNQVLDRTARLNTGFSQFAWANAKADGCLPCPGRSLPSWPPCGNFIYPTMQKSEQAVLGAHQYNPDLQECPDAAPFQVIAPEKNALTCAMTRANDFLRDRAEATSVPMDDMFNYDNLGREESSYDAANSILSGQIPMNLNGKKKNADAGDDDSQEVPLRDYMQHAASIPQKMMNTAFGMAYDLQHIDELPCEDDDKFNYVVMREERYKYVGFWILFVLFIILLIAAICVSCSGGSSGGSKKVPYVKAFPGMEDYQLVLRKKK